MDYQPSLPQPAPSVSQALTPDSQYRVTDVNIGGMSMKVALRDQFASWIETNGGRVNALLAVMRQQIAREW
jgi:ABC-type transporter MlaC component